MRILLVSHLFPSATHPGKGTFVRELALALAKDHEVRVLSGRYGDDTVLTSEGVEAVPVVLPWSPLLPGAVNVARASVAYARAIENQVGEWAPDVVHAHYAAPDGLACALSSENARAPRVVTFHGSDVNLQLRRPVAGGWLARKLVRGVDRFVCVSEAIFAVLQSAHPSLAQRSVVIRSGYDPRVFVPGPEAREPTILFVGSLTNVKRPDAVIEAHARTVERTGMHLRLVGDGPAREALEALVESLGVSDSVVFEGRLDRNAVADRMRRATFLVLASRSEGLPIAAIESMGSGTPVVATRVGGLPEIVDEGVTGVLVPEGDDDALARAFISAGEMSWDHGAIARLAGQRSWDTVASELLTLYHGLGVDTA